MAEREFKLETRFSDSSAPQLRLGALITAIVGIVVIILTMTTEIASHLLPMDDRYLVALIPQAPDGGEPLALISLKQDATDTLLTIEGTIKNRTDFSIANVEVVIEVQDRFGLTAQTVIIPVKPADLPTQEPGTFQASIATKEKLSGFKLKFQLANGPYVPHKDERALPSARFNEQRRDPDL
jgi:hypothetical protein